MKSVLALILFAATAFAQDTLPQAAAQGACGPKGVDFDVKTVNGQTVPQLEEGKALVFVNEVFKKAPGELGNPTIRIGLDGKWLGATRANSYFAFSVDPGEHHLCTNWQSKFKRLSREAAFTSFNAEAGKTYYFRARITYQGFDKAATMVLDLEAVNEDEGKYLVASSPASSIEAKH
jgi:Protein of unknown function (DUF2846)